jgi:hypothetical protein
LSDLALVLGAVAGYSARDDFAALSDKIAKRCIVFMGYQKILV